VVALAVLRSPASGANHAESGAGEPAYDAA
jgi:hypothetical protein